MYAQNSDGAKMLGLDVKEFVSQTAYEKLLCGEFKTFEDFNSFVSTKNDDANNWYTCFYFEQEKNEKTKYLIDSIFLRQ